MPRIVAFGEMMIRLATRQGVSIEDQTVLETYYGGSEGNTLILLSAFGEKTRYVTAFPKNPLGDGAVDFLRKKNVDTQFVYRNYGRMGLYFYENNFGQLNSRVVYDRQYSAIRNLTVDAIEMDAVFDDVSWFHITGISLALGENAKTLSFALVSEAKKRGIKASFDFNFRSTLTTKEEARKVYPEIVKNVDVLFGSIGDLQEFLGLEGNQEEIIASLFASYPLSVFAFTQRSNTDNQTMSLGATLAYRDGDTVRYCHLKPQTFPVLDRVGAGDCFDADVIEGLLHGNDYERALKLGLAGDILKHEVLGDTLSLPLETLERYISDPKFSLIR